MDPAYVFNYVFYGMILDGAISLPDKSNLIAQMDDRVMQIEIHDEDSVDEVMNSTKSLQQRVYALFEEGEERIMNYYRLGREHDRL